MWHTTRYEGFDEAKHTKRSPVGVATLQSVFTGLLRSGFLLQVLATTGLMLSYYIFKGTQLFTYDLKHTSEEQRSNAAFRVCLMGFAFMHLVGALYILFFQTVLADDASWARGYRAGAKFLGNAAFFDVVSSTLQFIIYSYMAAHYDKVWWKQFSQGGVEWLINLLTRLTHAFALFYYSSALFLLEVYHDNGTNDWHGIFNCVLFLITGIAELTVLSCGNPAVAIMLNWISLVSALVWAMAFEQEVNATAPLLNEPELTNEIEAQVEKFARATPYAMPPGQ